MNIALWIIQGLLALLFLFTGGMKLFAQDRYRQQAKQQHPDREFWLSRGLVTFIGASEVAGTGRVLVETTAALSLAYP